MQERGETTHDNRARAHTQLAFEKYLHPIIRKHTHDLHLAVDHHICDTLARSPVGTSPSHWLLLWARAVAGKYGVDVDNLSASLSDGRALCLLIHHYQVCV